MKGAPPQDFRYWLQSNANPARLEAQLRARIPEQRDGCWPWPGNKTRGGYGVIRTGLPNGPGDRQYVHRASYEMFVGPIPNGMQIDHLCRNRACFNPAHLDVVNNRTNFLRGNHPSAVGRRNRRCRNDLHDMTGDNVMIIKRDGSRRCKACYQECQRRRQQKQRANPAPA